MSDASPIVRRLLIRAAGEVLLAETQDDAEPLLVETLLDTLCELLADGGEPCSPSV
jgi:hypothetical protein